MVSSDNSSSPSSTTPAGNGESETEALSTSWMFLPFAAPTTVAVCGSSRGSFVGIAGGVEERRRGERKEYQHEVGGVSEEKKKGKRKKKQSSGRLGGGRSVKD